jgi:hypothetical protein
MIRASLVALMLVLGCAPVLGIEDLGARKEPLACGVPISSASCGSCLTNACCAEATRCSADRACSELAECTAKCSVSDTACASACRGRFGGGYSALVPLWQCRADRCTKECELSCGGYVSPNADCSKCATTSCCDLASTCMKDGACAALLACQHACADRDFDCTLKCELMHPAGVETQRALGRCVQKFCASSCVPAQWSCLKEPISPPAATGGALTLTYSFVEYATVAPAVGLRVRACGSTDFDCVAPMAEVVTDSSGRAILKLPNSKFDGYIEASDADHGPHLVFLPTLTKSFTAPTEPVINRASLAKIAMGLGVSLDDTRATLVARVFDCTDDGPAGVKLSVDPSDGSTPFYLIDKKATRSATATAADPTYAGGGFFNVRTNTALTVGATVVDNGLAYAPTVVFARPGVGSISAVMLLATPP